MIQLAHVTGGRSTFKAAATSTAKLRRWLPMAAQPSLPPTGHAPDTDPGRAAPTCGRGGAETPRPGASPDQDPMASEFLDLQVTAATGYAVVEVAGEIDVASAPELRDCLYQTIDAGSRQLVIDLRRISFIDSVGLGVLVGAQRRLRRDGHDGGVHLVVAEGLVLRVLRVTGLDRVFPLHATLTDALGDDAG
jgi:anti-sigma B factor antagonist